MSRTLPEPRAARIPITVHPSVLLMALLLSWMLADGFLPHAAPGHRALTYWVAALVGTALLIGSLMAHELAHAWVAAREGVRVEGLTLWLFGGVARLDGEPRSPGAELRIAAVGPGVSLGLAAVFAVVWWGLAVAGAGELVVGVAAWLVAINLVLGIFNLIPGAPLDGGRVLQAVLWHRHGDRVAAAVTAARAGQVVGSVLVALGALTLLAGDPVGGLWTVLIGVFVMSMARAEQGATTSQHLLGGATVADVMTTPVETVDATSTLAELVHDHVLHGRHSAFPVLDRHGAVTGMISLTQLRAVPAEDWATRLVGDVALPLEQATVCRPGDALTSMLHHPAKAVGGRAVVLDGTGVVGIVTPSDVTHLLETRQLVDPGR